MISKIDLDTLGWPDGRQGEERALLRNLILSGGIFHDFDGLADALDGVLAGCGFESVVERDVDTALARLEAERFDLLTVQALRWPMTNDEKYAPFRKEWAYSIGPDQQQEILAHLARGGGVLGLHTAAICFSDWPGWGEVLGGNWQWGKSYHPAPGPATVRSTSISHPIVEGIDSFTIEDEIFHGLVIAESVQPLLEARSHQPDTSPYQPVLWVNEHRAGRIVYSALGHDTNALVQPSHRLILGRAALWACRAS